MRRTSDRCAQRAAVARGSAGQNQPAGQRRIVDDLFRFFHSLKGISAMVELRPAEQLAHELENFLRAIRAGDVTVTEAGVSLLIEGTQLFEQIVNAHRSKVSCRPSTPWSNGSKPRFRVGRHRRARRRQTPRTLPPPMLRLLSRLPRGSARLRRRATCSPAGSASMRFESGSKRSARSSTPLR